MHTAASSLRSSIADLMVLGYLHSSAVHPRLVYFQKNSMKWSKSMESQVTHGDRSRASQPIRWRRPFAQVSLLISLFSLLIFFGIVEIVFQQRPLLQIDTIV